MWEQPETSDGAVHLSSGCSREMIKVKELCHRELGMPATFTMIRSSPVHKSPRGSVEKQVESRAHPCILDHPKYQRATLLAAW